MHDEGLTMQQTVEWCGGQPRSGCGPAAFLLSLRRTSLGVRLEVERAREPVKEFATPAQHLDHAGRDCRSGASSPEMSRWMPGPVAKARSTCPSSRVTSRVEPSTRMRSWAGPKRASYAVAGRLDATCGRNAIRSVMVIESGVMICSSADRPSL